MSPESSLAARWRLLLARVFGRVAQLIGGQDTFSFLMFDPANPSAAPPAYLGSAMAVSTLGRRLTRRVLESGRAVIVGRFEQDPLATEAAEHGIEAALALPLKVRGQTAGVVGFYLASAEQLTRDPAARVIERLRDVAIEGAPPSNGAATPATLEPLPRSRPRGQPMVDLVAAVVGEAMTRLDAEIGRAEELSEANRLKSEFVSVVSHELRSPLTYVMGFSEILAERELAPERVKYYAAEMHRESRRMLQIVNDLLDVSRLELGRLAIEPRPVLIGTEIQQIVRNIATTTEIHQLIAECPDDLTALVDPVRFWQVLQNLLSNAIRYAPDGGEVIVRGEVDPDNPGMARVSVRDHGVGIADDQIDRVFEKFYRVDGELKVRVRGSGLGLAICQAIVDSHGGRIWVESRPGEGSTFSFTLPLAEAPRGEWTP